MKRNMKSYQRIAAKVLSAGFIAFVLLWGAGCGKDECCRPRCDHHNGGQNNQNNPAPTNSTTTTTATTNTNTVSGTATNPDNGVQK